MGAMYVVLIAIATVDTYSKYAVPAAFGCKPFGLDVCCREDF